MPRLRNGLAGTPSSKPATKAYRDGYDRIDWSKKGYPDGVYVGELRDRVENGHCKIVVGNVNDPWKKP